MSAFGVTGPDCGAGRAGMKTCGAGGRYPSLGMEMMQRAYVLFRKQEDRIFLFEDRALETPFETSMVSNIAAEIVARSHVPLRDFGMVEGHGGLLAVWGTHALDWTAPSLPLAQQLRIWRHVAVTECLGEIKT